MKRSARLVAVLSVLAALLTTAGCNKLRARDQLVKGVKAYKNNNNEQAIEHFKNAVHFDPSYLNAKLYLAKAYSEQYVSGVETDENKLNATLAIEQYQAVLKEDPKNVNSLKGIALLNMQMKNFDASREFYKKAIEVDPEDPEAYYSVGVIDWTAVYKDAADQKAKVGLKLEDELKSKQDQKLCQQLIATNGPIIDEGLKYLQIASEKRQDYDNAMLFINLLYIRKAHDLTCGDDKARDEYMKMAADWTDKAMDARKRKAAEEAKKHSGAIVLDQTKQK